MTLQEIFDYVNFVISKDVSGQVLDPVRFNTLLNAVNVEYFRAESDKLLALSAQPSEVKETAYSLSPVKKFVEEWITYACSSGVETVPVDFEVPLAMTALINNRLKNVKIMTEDEFAVARTSLLQRDVTNNPVCVKRRNELKFYPPKIDKVYVTYLRMPQTPYYDYCLDSDDNIIEMPVGSYLSATVTPGVFDLKTTADDGEVVLYSGVSLVEGATHDLDYYVDEEDNVVVIPSGAYLRETSVGGVYEVLTKDEPTSATLVENVTKPGGVAGYDSLTTELDWEARFHKSFADRILEKVGMNIQSMETVQFAKSKEA